MIESDLLRKYGNVNWFSVDLSPYLLYYLPEIIVAQVHFQVNYSDYVPEYVEHGEASLCQSC